MVALGYMWLVIFLCLEVIAVIIGCVGVMHTGELGGRVAGVVYGVPTIVLAMTPPAVVWFASPDSLGGMRSLQFLCFLAPWQSGLDSGESPVGIDEERQSSVRRGATPKNPEILQARITHS